MFVRVTELNCLISSLIFGLHWGYHKISHFYTCFQAGCSARSGQSKQASTQCLLKAPSTEKFLILEVFMSWKVQCLSEGRG